MKTSINISSVEKAFLLLEFLAAKGKPATLQELTDAVKLAKPTAYRLLQTLHELGYVSRPSGSRSYLVGPRTQRLTSLDPQIDLKSRAQPLLRKLHEEFNETVNLASLSDGQVRYLDYLETTQALRYIVTPGQSDPWFCTALGRAAASQLSDKALSRLIANTQLQPITPETVRTRNDLLQRVKKVRSDGYAQENEESIQGVSCLAVGLAPLGFPESAISISMPSHRLTAKKKAAIIKLFKSLLSNADAFSVSRRK